MEYLVSMTTRVPDATTAEEVALMRVREAGRAAELSEQGALLRLWRPPLQPGEWRTVGLFAAVDADVLEQDLISMPLRAWRTDEVTALATHPNDPGVSPSGDGIEFLVVMTVTVPPEVPHAVSEVTYAQEAERARWLAAGGYLTRLWSLPHGQTLGLWQASDGQQLTAMLDELPLRDWMSYETTPLSTHPNDPGRRR
ncbi:muconolactone delta-isomerase [Mycobacterium sp. 852013-50091_SCH5140682]|uniref:muconolactone Delta-isomerase family protein n=1 Tax=Mycobacterium sp. 852013-50091_SCH5140682 TaxID=1834109 RepID=UPI0007EB2ECC|nr:muconolactone Delta-isomerase family protein [Mycobacterium sp. 852013-50091_SCH5140682]OBC00123.1 muconolactone delta-isomerase [Mycobacterium sp. 852013-50091_SCH5140682]